MKVNVHFGGAGTILTVLFVILKVMGKIDWSWWWVFAPLWLPFCIWIVIMLVIALLAVWADS